MATKKLQDLTASTSPGDADIMLIEDTTATKKITFLNLFNRIKTKLGLATVATSGKLADTVKDEDNRTITDAERAKWNGYGNDLASLNRNLTVKTRTIEGAYLNMQVTSYGEIAWVRISGYPKVAMKQGQEYKLFQPSSETPRYGLYRRISITSTSGFVFQMSADNGEISITPFGADITTSTGVNVSECYIMK